MTLRPALLLAPLLLAACEEPRSEVPRERSNAVTVSETSPPPPTARPTARTAPAGERKFCSGQTPRPAPKRSVRSATASDAPALGSAIPFGVGKWIWVNLWAAWCEPCKKEMPELLAWQEKLAKAGVMIELAFVSLDDDERELKRFLEAQPKTGVRASYWLTENERAGFLQELGVREKAALPVQAFVAPSGQVACVFEGAVEERDYAQIAALVGKP